MQMATQNGLVGSMMADPCGVGVIGRSAEWLAHATVLMLYNRAGGIDRAVRCQWRPLSGYRFISGLV